MFVIIGIRYFGTVKNDIELFKQIEPTWLIVAFITQAGTYFFNAITYQVLLQKHLKNTSVPLKELFEATIVMLFLNQTIPSAGASGGTFLLSLLRKNNISTGDSIFVILANLLIHYISMVFFAILLIILTPILHFPHNYTSIFITGIVIYLIMGVFVTIGGERETQKFLASKIGSVSLVRKVLQKYKTSFGLNFSNEEKLLKTLISNKIGTLQGITYDISFIICDILTIFALFHGLGIQSGFITVTACYILTQIITILPISPGSLLIYEGSMSFFFKQLELPLEASITVTLLYRCLSFWIPIPLGYLLYGKLNRSTINSTSKMIASKDPIKSGS